MKITWVIMECIVMIHSTVWLTYEALGSVVLVASAPHRPRGGALGTHGCHCSTTQPLETLSEHQLARTGGQSCLPQNERY